MPPHFALFGGGGAEGHGHDGGASSSAGSSGDLAMAALESRVAQANKYVENEYQGLAEVFKRLKMESTATVDDWKKHAGALSQACDKVRDDLKELGSTASKGKCTKAEDVALPQLFKRRSHQRSRPKDTIEGCAVVDDRKALTPTDCNCAAGDEAKGCKDAANDSDHVLQCAHLRRRVLGELKLERLFSTKGACTVDLSAPFNEDLLPPGAPENFSPPWRQAGLAPPQALLAAGGPGALPQRPAQSRQAARPPAAPSPRRAAAAPRRRWRGGAARATRGRAFL